MPPWTRPGRSATALLAVAMMSFVTGCGGTDGPSSGAYCGIAQPLRFSRAAVAAMDRADLQQVDAFNSTGERLCGWRP